MTLDVNDILARYQAEVAHLTHRVILAEARADAAESSREQDGGHPEKVS